MGGLSARAARHLLVAPLFVVTVLLAVLLSPLLLLLAALLSVVVDRHWRPLRALLFILTYAVHDVLALLGGLGLWLRLRGGGPMDGEAMQTRHYALIAWLLRRLSDAAVRILALRVVVDGDADAEDALRALRRPVIVLSRHAGPGDSFLLVHELLRRGRRPRIVLRAALQLDPCIDVLGHRLPFCFVSRAAGGSDATVERIAAIAGGMDPRGALLLFPEGGNFTPERRRGAIRHLLRLRRRRHARLAASMRHVVAPRPAGALSALQAAPGADVILVAHSGLAGMDQRLWRRVPVDRTLRVHLWRIPAEQVPADDDARIEALFSWWLRLDAWVEENAPSPSHPAPAS